MIKFSTQVSIEGTYLNIIKAVYNKPTANIRLYGKKLKSFSSQIKNKTKMPTLRTFIQIVLQVLARAIKQEKEVKGI